MGFKAACFGGSGFGSVIFELLVAHALTFGAGASVFVVGAGATSSPQSNFSVAQKSEPTEVVGDPFYDGE